MDATVDILLASYNGEAYIAQQLESLLTQDFSDFSILISDDDSQDATVEVVRRYAAVDARVRLVSTGVSHGGARDNFLSLVNQATAPYLAFCDQDDVWLCDKLAIELAKMHELEETYGTDVPLLVFSDLAVVDENLEVMSPSFMAYGGIDPTRTSLANLLAQNVAPGCVMLANRALYHEALRLPLDQSSIIMHDWWFILTAAALGHIGYVNQPTMLYRQHGSNTVGAESNTTPDILSRLGSFTDRLLPSEDQLASVDIRLAQARAFAEAYKDALSLRDRGLCLEFAELLDLPPAERVSWCRAHDVQNASPVMRLGMDWELFLYDRARARTSHSTSAPYVTAPPMLDPADVEDLPPVAVVMSTYNGERYLKEQIDSILSQDLPHVRLFVRDDGSTDATLEILQHYADQGLLEFVAGENRGVVGSFFEALALPPAAYQFVAFCDQDDVWHPGKLRRALSVLVPRDQSIPQLYCSEYLFCDEKLENKSPSHLNRIGVGFSTLLVETICSGNTSVMNRVLVDEMLDNGTEGVYLHDWWCALVAVGLGELSFDDYASLDYRRIESSVSPTGSGGLSLLLYRIRTFLGDGQLKLIDRQLEHFRDRYADRLKPDDLALLNRMLDGGRLSKALAPVHLRQKPTEELAVRVLYLLGLL